MPQLRGGEKKVLFEILVEHVGEEQLGRALSFHDLPPLDQLAGEGTLRDRSRTS